MDPYLPAEPFNPLTGDWIGRGPRRDPAPELWARVWELDWPAAEAANSEPEPGLLRDRFQFEATCFAIGFAIGVSWGRPSGFYCGVVAILWARLRGDRYGLN